MSENIWLTRLCAHGYILVDDDGGDGAIQHNSWKWSGLVWCGNVKISELNRTVQKMRYM